MLRGVLGGFLTGTILSGLALGAASVLTDIPGQAPPEAAGLDVPSGSEFNQSREDTGATLPGADETPDADAVPKIVAPAPDDLSSLEAADMSPASQPVTGEAEGTLGTPEAREGGAGVEVGSDSPVLHSPQALAPEAPEGEEDLRISTEPAQPVLPEVEEDSGVLRNGGAAGMEMPEPEEAPSGTIGDPAGEAGTGPLPPVDEVAADGEDAPPLDRFSAQFENPEGKPLMAIVLIDDGESLIGHDALADFPYPVSYAIDAGWPGAARAAERYRAAGLEVLAMADLPETAADAEGAMQSYLEAVPDAVAVMEGTGAGLQASRETAEQLIPILQDSGHGLVLFSDGRDTARKIISREGVPVAGVFRDLDGKRQDAAAIRRYLDYAAVRAGQEEHGVVMVGRLRPETVSALLLWGLQDRAGSVALAPVSAVLKAARQGG